MQNSLITTKKVQICLELFEIRGVVTDNAKVPFFPFFEISLKIDKIGHDLYQIQ